MFLSIGFPAGNGSMYFTVNDLQVSERLGLELLADAVFNTRPDIYLNALEFNG